MHHGSLWSAGNANFWRQSATTGLIRKPPQHGERVSANIELATQPELIEIAIPNSPRFLIVMSSERAIAITSER
jgi:hypothetical protein